MPRTGRFAPQLTPSDDAEQGTRAPVEKHRPDFTGT
jgi:hypothetical protein